MTKQQELIPHLFRTEYRKIVSVLCRHFGFDQIEIAEDIAGETATALAERGARVFLAGGEAAGATTLATIACAPLLEPVVQIQSFYRAANALALTRGLDPDRPPHLAKVTETR